LGGGAARFLLERRHGLQKKGGLFRGRRKRELDSIKSLEIEKCWEKKGKSSLVHRIGKEKVDRACAAKD